MRSTAKVDTRTIDYTGYAARYDAARFSGRTNEYLGRIRLRALARVVRDLPREARALDVGSGTGFGLCALLRAGFTSVIGVDFTQAMLDRAASNIRLTGAARARLVRGDGFRLPFPEGTFPLVISLNFLHMFRYDLQQELVAEMTRVCARGGFVIVELESIHKGLGITRYLEQRQCRERTKFNSVFESRRLFPQGLAQRVKVVGTVLPLAYKALRHMPELGEKVESITFVPPFNWLASRVLVVGRRAR